MYRWLRYPFKEEIIVFFCNLTSKFLWSYLVRAILHELLWRESACHQVKYIARNSKDRKVKKYVPINIWRWLPNLNSLTMTALACTSLCSSSHNSPAGNSYFDNNKRLQANKRCTSRRVKTSTRYRYRLVVYLFRYQNSFFGYCLQRVCKQLYRTTLLLSANNCTARPYFSLINVVVNCFLCIFRPQSEFSAKYADNAFCGRNHCSPCSIS